MTADPLDALIAALGSSDEAAAEHAFRTFEPVLRAIVRRRLPAHLRSRFDSVDVVQSTWADLVEGLRSNRWRFGDAAQLRAFLIRAASNRLIDRVRQHRAARDRERATGEAALSRPSGPTPSQTAQADELWNRMLAACPPTHRGLLLLRREGLSTAEIAARLGLNDGSVRRILGEIAGRLSLGVEPRRARDASS